MGKIRNRLTATKQKNHLVRLFYNLGSYESLGSGESNKTHKTFQSSLWREIFAIFVSLPGKLFSAYPIPPTQPTASAPPKPGHHPTNTTYPIVLPYTTSHLPYTANSIKYSRQPGSRHRATNTAYPVVLPYTYIHITSHLPYT
jgi:hypothetical protein